MKYETIDTDSIRNLIAKKTHVNGESPLNNRIQIQKLADEDKNFCKILGNLLKAKVLTLKEASVFALHHGFYGINGKRLPRANFTEMPMIFNKINKFQDVDTPDVAMILYNSALNKLATADVMEMIKEKTMSKEDIDTIFHSKSKDDNDFSK